MNNRRIGKGTLFTDADNVRGTGALAGRLRRSFSGARTATLNAARDLYGANSTQYNAVAAAWSAVSVN
jgi:Zn-dependent metalloprotease